MYDHAHCSSLFCLLNLTERTKKEIKNKKKQQEQNKQKKISDTWKLLPEHEQRNLLKEEEKARRFELREIKVNIWKKWRKETEDKNKETKENDKTHQEKC